MRKQFTSGQARALRQGERSLPGCPARALRQGERSLPGCPARALRQGESSLPVVKLVL